MSWLRNGILGLLAVCTITGVWLVVMIYRHIIAPLQTQLIKSQTIINRQEKLVSLGVLAAGVAHEIRNPLTAIRARLFTQQQVMKEGTPEYQDSVFISDEIERLEQIVQNVLLFARPAELERKEISIGELIKEVCALIKPQFEKSGIQLKCSVANDIHIFADAHQLKQALLNLIRNAEESIEGTGTITLHAHLNPVRCQVRLTPPVVTGVDQTGKGISPETQQRLFDPFYSTKSNGTGLGLAITARIVDKHGGMIQYRTRTNFGTTCELVFPLVKKDEKVG